MLTDYLSYLLKTKMIELLTINITCHSTLGYYNVFIDGNAFFELPIRNIEETCKTDKNL